MTAEQRLEALEHALQDIAEAECEYGDSCTTFGSRHGRCHPCTARKALTECGIKLRWEDL